MTFSPGTKMLELHILPSGGRDYIHIRNCSRDSDTHLWKKKMKVRNYFCFFKKLVDIFSYIEPVECNLSCYGHRLRELIILASTEFENQCRHILRANHIFPQGNDYISKDFVKLNIPAHLSLAGSFGQFQQSV